MKKLIKKKRKGKKRDISQAGAVTHWGPWWLQRAQGSLCHRWVGLLRSTVLKERGCTGVRDLMLHSWDIEECRCPGQRVLRSGEQDGARALGPLLGPLGASLTMVDLKVG